MVKRAHPISFALALVLFSATVLPAREYRIGDKAQEDIFAPVQIDIVDLEATDVLKEREARREPVIYRFYPHAASEVEAAFHSTFLTTHVNFLDALEATYHKRKLNPEEIASPDFQRFVASFQKQNILLPVGLNVATVWAGADSDQKIESTLITELRETMKAYIRSEVSPDDIWVGSTIRLVSPGDNEATTAQIAADRGMNVAKTNFVSLPRAKSELQGRFAAEDHDLARYVASFIKPNCLMEADLTRDLRAKRTEGIMAAYHYDPGQVIVKRGQFIDKKIKAALDQINGKTTVAQTAPPPSPTVATAPATTGPATTATEPVKAVPVNNWTPWVFGVSLIFLLLIAFILSAVWALTRRQGQPSLMPVPSTGLLGPTEPELALTEEEAWQRRMMAQKAQAAARAGLVSQLAQWFADKMTQKLISQRSELLDAHQKAAIEMAELEARLVKVHAPLQERLQAYERRIAELEKELSVMGEENRELIKAKIQIVKKQMEIEREKNRLEYN